MRRFFKILRPFALCCLGVLLAGCEQPQTLPDGDATELVKKAVETRASLKNLIGRGEMKIVDKGHDFSLSIKIDLAAQTPDRLRIRATKLADAIVAFDMLMYGSQAAFYVPTRNTLYKGNADNLKQGGVNFSPREIIARILHSDHGLLDRQWKVLGKSKQGLFRQDLVLEQIHKRGQPYVKIHVDGRRAVLLKVMHYDAQGKLFFVEEYNGYKEIMTGQNTLSGNEIGSGVFLPSRFILDWPDKGRMVSVILRDYEFDVSEATIAESWTIDDLDPKTVKVKNLNQVDVESDRAALRTQSAAAPSAQTATDSRVQTSTAPPVRTAQRAQSADSPAPSTGSGSAGVRGRTVSDPF